MTAWYLIHTKIRQEQTALQNLQQQGFECFLPLIQVEKLLQGSRQVVPEPLFPRYLFIRMARDLSSQSWSPIRSALGVSRLIALGQNPAKIDEDVVDSLRLGAQSATVQRCEFEAGDAVVLSDVPFVDMEALFQMRSAEGRVIILLNMLSKQVKLRVERLQVHRTAKYLALA